MTHEQYPVRPCAPVAPWIGGKSRLADTIIHWINSVEHGLYAEPFIGMGGVFLRRTQRPKAEVINDRSHDVANLFRVCRRHPEELVRALDLLPFSRAEFLNMLDSHLPGLTDIERAARFLYILKSGFGGKAVTRSFAVQRESSGRFNSLKIAPLIRDLHARLSTVTIECLDYQDFIPLYDSDGALFYLDPPYWGCEDDYGKNLFSRDDFERIADILAQIKGRFLLSLNDTPEVRDIFRAFDMHEVVTKYTINGAHAQDAPELIIHNLDSVPQVQQGVLI